MHKKILITVTAVFIFNIFSLSSVQGEIQDGRTSRDIEKFRAHTSVRKMLKENGKKINLIEIISRNFGYTDYIKLKKDYTAAKLLVYKKKITQADTLLKKNLEDINISMEKISRDYEASTQAMIDECIDKINELKFSSVQNPDIEIQRKLLQNEKKIRLANRQFDSAVVSYIKFEYVSAITLYRSAKTHAIDILKNLADPEDKEKINEKFKIHVVDNRNEVFSEG